MEEDLMEEEIMKQGTFEREKAFAKIWRENETYAKLQLPNGESGNQTLFVKGTWYPTHFMLSIMDGQDTWDVNATQEFVAHEASEWNMEVEEWLDQVHTCLREQYPKNNYSFTSVGTDTKMLQCSFFDKALGERVLVKLLLQKISSCGKVAFQMLELLLNTNTKQHEELARKTRDIQRMTGEINELRYNHKEHIMKEHGYHFTNSYVNNDYMPSGHHLESNVAYCQPSKLETIVLYDEPLEVESNVTYCEPSKLETIVLYDEPLEVESNVAYCQPSKLETIVLYDEPLEVESNVTYYEPPELEKIVVYDEPLKLETIVVYDQPLEFVTNVVYDKPLELNRMSTNQISKYLSVTEQYPIDFEQTEQHDDNWNQMSSSRQQQLDYINESISNHKDIFDNISEESRQNSSMESFEISHDSNIIPTQKNLNQLNDLSYDLPCHYGDELSNNYPKHNSRLDWKNDHKNMYINIAPRKVIIEKRIIIETDLKETIPIQRNNKQVFINKQTQTHSTTSYNTINEIKPKKFKYQDFSREEFQNEVKLNEKQSSNEKQSGSKVNFHHSTINEEKKGKVYYKTPKHSYAQSKIGKGGYESDQELDYKISSVSRSKSYVPNKKKNENHDRSSRWSTPSKVALNDDVFYDYDSKVDTLVFDVNQEDGKSQIESSHLENQTYVKESTNNNKLWPLNSLLDEVKSLFDPLDITNIESLKEENSIHEPPKDFENGSQNNEQTHENFVHSILHHTGEQHPHHEHIVWGENSTSDGSKDISVIHQSNAKFKPSYISQHEQHTHDEHIVCGENSTSNGSQEISDAHYSNTKFKPSYVSNAHKSLQSVPPNNEEQSSANVIIPNNESQETTKSPSFVESVMSVFKSSPDDAPESKSFVKGKAPMYPNIEQKVEDQRKNEESLSTKHSSMDVHMTKSESNKSTKSPSFVETFMSLFQSLPNNLPPKVVSENEILESKHIEEPTKYQNINEELMSIKQLTTNAHSEESESSKVSDSPSFVQSFVSLFEDTPRNTLSQNEITNESVESQVHDQKVNEETLSTKKTILKKTKSPKLTKSLSYAHPKESKSPKLTKSLSYAHTKETKSPKLTKSLSFGQSFMALFQSSPNNSSIKRLSTNEDPIQTDESRPFEAISTLLNEKSDDVWNVSTLFASYHEPKSTQLSTISNDNKNKSTSDELTSKFTIQHEVEECSPEDEFINDRNIMDESRRASIEQVRKELSFKLEKRQEPELQEEENISVLTENKHGINPHVSHAIMGDHEPRRYSIDKIGINFRDLQQRSQSTSISRRSLYSNSQNTRPKSNFNSRFSSPTIQNIELKENAFERESNNDFEREKNHLIIINDDNSRKSMNGKEKEPELENDSQHSIPHSRQASIAKNNNQQDVANVMNKKIEESMQSNCQTLTPSNNAFLNSKKSCDINNNILCIAKIRFVLPKTSASRDHSMQSHATTNTSLRGDTLELEQSSPSGFRIGVIFNNESVQRHGNQDKE